MKQQSKEKISQLYSWTTHNRYVSVQTFCLVCGRYCAVWVKAYRETSRAQTELPLMWSWDYSILRIAVSFIFPTYHFSTRTVHTDNTKRPRLGGFESLTTLVTKSSVFWDITPCSPLKINRRFGRTCHLHLQGRRISQARNQHESSACHLLSCLTYSSTQNI
jgi:hypothetical protein